MRARISNIFSPKSFFIVGNLLSDGVFYSSILFGAGVTCVSAKKVARLTSSAQEEQQQQQLSLNILGNKVLLDENHEKKNVGATKWTKETLEAACKKYLGTPDDTYGVSCTTFMDNLRAGMKPEDALKALPAMSELTRQEEQAAAKAAAKAEAEGIPTTTTTTPPPINMCRCETPGKGAAGHNKFTCDDGTERYCAATDECFNGSPFPHGQWHEGCRTIQIIQWAQEVHDQLKNLFSWR